MSTRRLIASGTTGFGVACLLTAQLVAGQQTAKPMTGHDMPMPKTGSMNTEMKMNKAQKITNATAAAPAAVSAKATVLDWPAKEGSAPELLRAGTNGWTCFPDFPESKGNDPMCVDDVWMKWFDAYMAHKPPVVTRVGIGYMTAAGGAWGSNSDPYAMTETMDNHWGHHQPHMMILVPDQKSLDGIPADPKAGGPYVMFPGTPFAHIMAPIAGR